LTLYQAVSIVIPTTQICIATIFALLVLGTQGDNGGVECSILISIPSFVKICHFIKELSGGKRHTEGQKVS